MAMPTPEPSDLEGLGLSILMTAIMVVSYFTGIWIRNYVFPTHTALSLKRQLIGGVPVACLTMGPYVVGIENKLLTADAHPGDWLGAVGTAIVFGMLSREALEKLLRARPTM